MNAKTLEAITKHGNSLLAVFPNAIEKNPVALCKKLRRIENAVSKPILDYCNGDCDEETINSAVNKAHKKLCELMGFSTAFRINRDPRGYALKIDDTWMRQNFDISREIHRDWGGYGILAPDLNN